MATLLQEPPVTGSNAATTFVPAPVILLSSPPTMLAMLATLDAVMIDDSTNEPPDFVVPDDDLGH